MGRTEGKTSAFADWLGRTRKPITWIYCSAVLFPLAFALVAALVMTVRGHTAAVGGFFASFYLVLMVLLASVPRSVLPALLVWLSISRFRPRLDENKTVRYLGLAVLIAIALFSHSKVYDRPFNFIWMAIAVLAVALPRVALPSLRDGLYKP